jgi:hypothetical protein
MAVNGRPADINAGHARYDRFEWFEWFFGAAKGVVDMQRGHPDTKKWLNCGAIQSRPRKKYTGIGV